MNRPHFLETFVLMSKKFIFSSILMLLSLMSYGQQYRTMLTEGREWWYTCNIYCGSDIAPAMTHAFIHGDTIVNNYSCKKLYIYSGKDSWDMMQSCYEIFPGNLYGRYHSAWYENNDEVYMIPKGSTQPNMMFDFGLVVGDRLPQNESLVFWYEDSISVKGETYRRMRFAEGDLTVNPKLSDWCLVEGIGGNEGILFTEFQIKPKDTDFCILEQFDCLFQVEVDYERNSCHYENLFTRNDFLINGTSSVNDHTSTIDTKTLHPSCYFDLQGRHLTEKPSQPGIYIQSGRKYVVK